MPAGLGSEATVQQRLLLELAAKDEQVTAMSASLEIARHVQRVTDDELQEQKRLAERAAAAHRTSSSEVALHKGQVDGNLSDLKSLRTVVQQLLADQQAASVEHAELVAAAQSTADFHRQDAEALRHDHEAALNDAERRHRLALRSSELTREHLTRQLACAGSGELTEGFVTRHAEALQAAHERCDRLEAANRTALDGKEQGVREAREQANGRATEQVEAARAELETLQMAHAAELSEVETSHRSQLKQVHELKAQLVQQLAEASEPSSPAGSRDSEPAELVAEMEQLKAELEVSKGELARSRSAIMLGARQSEACMKVLAKSRAEAGEDRERAAKQKQQLDATQAELAQARTGLGDTHARAEKLEAQLDGTETERARLAALLEQSQGELVAGLTSQHAAELTAVQASVDELQQQLDAASAVAGDALTEVRALEAKLDLSESKLAAATDGQVDVHLPALMDNLAEAQAKLAEMMTATAAADAEETVAPTPGDSEEGYMYALRQKLQESEHELDAARGETETLRSTAATAAADQTAAQADIRKLQQEVQDVKNFWVSAQSDLQDQLDAALAKTDEGALTLTPAEDGAEDTTDDDDDDEDSAGADELPRCE